MTNLMPKKNRTFLIIIAFIVLYAIFFIISDLEKFSYRLENINYWYILPILAIGTLAMFVRSLRQKLFFDSLGISMSYKTNIQVYFSGLSMIMTPAGFGQVIKSYFLKKKYNHPYTKSLSVVLAERYYDLFSEISVIIIALLFVSSFEGMIISIVMGIVVVLILVSVKNKKLFSKMVSIIPKRWWFKKIEENKDDFFACASILTSKKLFFLGWLYGLTSWLLVAVTFYLAFIAFGLDHSFFEAIIINFIPGILGAVSMLPGGIGITEFGMLGLLLKSGTDITTASALILFIRFTTGWFYTILGIINTKFVTRHIDEQGKKFKP